MNASERQTLRELAERTQEADFLTLGTRQVLSLGSVSTKGILDLLDDIDRLEATVRRLVEKEPILASHQCIYCRKEVTLTGHDDDCVWWTAKREFRE